VNRSITDVGPWINTKSEIALGVLFGAAGLNHLWHPLFYLAIMPPYLPWPRMLVFVSGLAEAALGIAVMIPQSRRTAAWGLMALLVAVFPANIQMALHPNLYPGIPPLLLWLRLPLQPVLALWPYQYTRRRKSA
jgi:uncharacterized membrane protein